MASVLDVLCSLHLLGLDPEYFHCDVHCCSAHLTLRSGRITNIQFLKGASCHVGTQCPGGQYLFPTDHTRDNVRMESSSLSRARTCSRPLGLCTAESHPGLPATSVCTAATTPAVLSDLQITQGQGSGTGRAAAQPGHAEVSFLALHTPENWQASKQTRKWLEKLF